MSFCSVEQLMRRLDIIPNEQDIVELEFVLDASLQIMKDFTGRDLVYSQYTEYYPSQSGKKLYTVNIPIDEKKEIECYIDGKVFTNFQIYSDYLFSKSGWKCLENIKLIYYAGYNVENWHYQGLSWIQREIAAIVWKRGGSKNFSIDNYATANFVIAELNTELDKILSLLHYYRRLKL